MLLHNKKREKFNLPLNVCICNFQLLRSKNFTHEVNFTRGANFTLTVLVVKISLQNAVRFATALLLPLRRTRKEPS